MYWKLVVVKICKFSSKNWRIYQMSVLYAQRYYIHNVNILLASVQCNVLQILYFCYCKTFSFCL